MVDSGGCEDQVEREGDVGGWSMGWVESMKECRSKGAIMGSREYGFGI